MLSKLEKNILELTDKWKRLGRGAPAIKVLSNSNFAICEIPQYPFDGDLEICASSSSIEEAVQGAIAYAEEDLEERRKALLSQAESLIKKANSL